MSSKAWTLAGITACLAALAGVLVALAHLLQTVTSSADELSKASVAVAKAGENIGIGSRVTHIEGPFEQLNLRASQSSKTPCVEESDPLWKIVNARLVLFDIFPGSPYTQDPVTISDDGRKACAKVAAQDPNNGKNSAFKARIDADAIRR